MKEEMRARLRKLRFQPSTQQLPLRPLDAHDHIDAIVFHGNARTANRRFH